VPRLPENPGRLKDVRLELWLRSTTTEAQALVKLSKVPLARPLINRYLEAILPELAALAENRSVDSVGEWLVISLGAPKAGPSISIFNPDGTLRRFLPGGDRKPGE
jgi:hypothetical protein